MKWESYIHMLHQTRF